MKNSKTFILSLVTFIIVLTSSVFIYYVQQMQKEHEGFLSLTMQKEASAVFNNIVATMHWNANSGGVYVPEKKSMPPKDNQQKEVLLKINPNTMAQQIADVSNAMNEYRFNLIRFGKNKPVQTLSSFEKQALAFFENNQEENVFYRNNEALQTFQFMGTVKVEQSCIACHSANYKLGDTVGAIALSFPFSQYDNELQTFQGNHNTFVFVIIVFAIIIAIGLIYIINVVMNKQVLIQTNIQELEALKVDNETLIKRYKYAVEGSQSGIWDWNIVTNEIYFDNNWKGMLGYKHNELANHFDEWEMRVHPHDKDNAIQSILDNQERKTEYYLNVHRLRHKHGHWVWVLDRGKTYFNEQGKAVRMVGFHTDISDFKELELQLHEQEESLTTAQKIAQMGHWRYNNAKDSFVVSHTLYELLSLPKEIKIRSYKDFLEFVHEDDQENFLFQHKTIFQTKSQVTLQYRMKKYGSGEEIYIDEHISFVDNEKLNDYGYIGTMQDITILKNAEQELMLFKKIMDTTPISIVITNKEANLIYVNKHFCKVTGYTEQEALGKNPRILKSENTSSNEYDEMWEMLQSKKTWGGIFRNIAKDKREYWETALIVPVLDDKVEIINYLGIKREITKEIYLEKELKEKEELMLVQSRYAAMGEMISMIAHQWRQPITTISMMANNILADIELEIFEEKTAKTFALELSKQTQYLSETIEDFRNFFKQDKLTQECQLQEIFDNINSIISASLKNHNIQLRLEYDPALTIKTYVRELLQVLINLIKNAKEASEQNSVQDPFIEIVVQQKQQYLEITVTDNAGGIEKEHLQKIFEAYFTTKEEHNGTGLGLYMSKMIVQKHLKGNLTVRNVNEGVQFTITLQQFLE